MIDRDHRRAKALRLLHVLGGQMLAEEHYPHDLDMLLSVLERAVEGRLLPEEAFPCEVTVSVRDIAECLSIIHTDYRSSNRDATLHVLKDEMAAYDAARRDRRPFPYEAKISVPRIPKGLLRRQVPEWLHSIGEEPATIEDASAYSAKNWGIHANEGIVCLDMFTCGGQDHCFVSVGKNGYCRVEPRQLGPDQPFDPRWRVFARALPAAATP